MTDVEIARSAPAYRPAAGYYDELYDSEGKPRPHAAALIAGLDALGPEQLAAAGRRRDAIFVQQGITFEAVSDKHLTLPPIRLV